MLIGRNQSRNEHGDFSWIALQKRYFSRWINSIAAAGARTLPSWIT
jgi:hypothetical protein